MTTVSEMLKPPPTTVGVLGWLRRNLFSTWYNSLLTLVSLWVLYSLGSAVVAAFAGADWGVVSANLRLFMIGRYPVSQAWRVQAAVSLFALLAGATWAVWGGVARSAVSMLAALFVVLALLPFELDSRLWLLGNLLLIALGFGIGHGRRARRLVATAWLVSPLVVLVLLYGVGLPPLLTVATDVWGGLLLTVTLAVVGIGASFPLGVLLAIGRQSSFPVIRAFCVLYIELIRGVPLVTILFMMQIMLPLFLPEGVTVERVVRAMVGFAVFTSAYLAETVRGGLQSIGRGQGEAARALGLSGVQTLGLIILPQALRAVIPAIVGQFISLFKDTSLVLIVGLLDLAGIATSVIQQQAFLGRQAEAYVFIALIYFAAAASMSWASRRLEQTLGVGQR
jgi:general L-amino acid transport system permease protein